MSLAHWALMGLLSAAAAEPFPENFRLIDSGGKAHTMEENGSDARVVLMALDPACPWSAQLARWAESVVGPGTRLLFVDPAAGGEARATAAALHTRAPVLMDFSQGTTRDLGFRDNGDFLVLDPKNRATLERGGAFAGSLAKEAGILERAEGWFRGAPGPRVACALPLGPPPAALTPETAAAFTRSCNACHSRNEATDYFRSFKDLKSWHAMNLRVMRLFQMPPGGVDPITPLCRLFSSEGSEEDLRLVRDWIQAGEPRAAGAPDEIARQYSQLKRARARARAEAVKPDLTWKAKAVDHIAPEGNRYVLATLAGPLKEDLHVRLFDLRHNPRVTHHSALLLSDQPFEARKWNFKSTPESELDSDRFLVPLISWGRTISDTSLRGAPAGTFFLLPKGKYVGLLEHYEADGRAEENRASLDLYLDRAPGKALHVVNLGREKFRLAPGQRNFVLRKTWTADHDVSLVMAFTHGHYRFVASSIEITLPGKAPRNLCNMPYRQAPYNPSLYRQVMRLPKGSEVKATLVYDNSIANAGNPDAQAWVSNGGMTNTNEMDLVRIVYADGFLPEAVSW